MSVKVGDKVRMLNDCVMDMFHRGDEGVVTSITPKFYIQFPHRFTPTYISSSDKYEILASEEESTSLHVPGAKDDGGKVRTGLVVGGFAKALNEVSKVGTFGANKYTDNGWKTVPNALGRYTDAMLRHYMAEMGGEEVDPESGLLHAAHTAWNALARLHFILEAQNETDHRGEEQASEDIGQGSVRVDSSELVPSDRSDLQPIKPYHRYTADECTIHGSITDDNSRIR